MIAIPEETATKPLTDLVTLVRGVSYKKGVERRDPLPGYIRLLRANNIQGNLTFNDVIYVPESCVKSEQILKRGDVVVAMSSGSKSIVGKAAQFWNDDVPTTFGAFCGVLRPKDIVDPLYLGWFLRTDQYRHFISDASAGVNINNLKREYFEQVEVPAPFREQQEAISATISSLIEATQSPRDRLATIPALLKKFRQSVLAAACSGQLTADWRAQNDDVSSVSELITDCRTRAEGLLGKKVFRGSIETDFDLPDLPETWTWEPLGNVTLKVGDVDHRMPKHLDGGIPYISTKDFTARGIDFSKAKRISEEDFNQLSRKIRPHHGDILISRYGTVGEVRRIETNAPHQVSYSVAIVNCHEFEFLSKWLAFVLTSPTPQEFMRKHTRATSQPDLGLQHIRVIPVPIAPKQEQAEIMCRVESLFALADSIESRLADATAQVERTTQAILAKAFRGELTGEHDVLQ